MTHRKFSCKVFSLGSMLIRQGETGAAIRESGGQFGDKIDRSRSLRSYKTPLLAYKPRLYVPIISQKCLKTTWKHTASSYSYRRCWGIYITKDQQTNQSENNNWSCTRYTKKTLPEREMVKSRISVFHFKDKLTMIYGSCFIMMLVDDGAVWKKKKKSG